MKSATTKSKRSTKKKTVRKLPPQFQAVMDAYQRAQRRTQELLGDVAAAQARSGLVPGENVTLRVPVLRDDCD